MWGVSTHVHPSSTEVKNEWIYPLRTVRPLYRTGVPLPSRCCILYIFFSTNISTEYLKHAAPSLFFSSKCCLFHNATFFVHVLFTFYIEGVLKFKCKTPVPKGYISKTVVCLHGTYRDKFTFTFKFVPLL